ncbi:MAG: glycosyltransferase [Chitinophagales bacterium]|nr:glycosyltransferase [Chitinophagales bacterium]
MISVLTVTYGNRWHLLNRVLMRLIEDETISFILIVNNDVSYNISLLVSELNTSKIKLLNLDKNYGSAKAYNIGLSYLAELNKVNLIWLLDDDNLPLPNASRVLLKYWSLISCHDKNESRALLSIRKDRKYLMDAAHGLPVKMVFPRGNLFLGFGIVELVNIIIYKISRKKFLKKGTLLESIKIPMAPYGGLFFHKNILFKIGLPDERFFVYVDDFEFTYRITKTGGEIWLISESEIVDIDDSWIIKTQQGLFKSRYLQQADFRPYYTIRNYTYFAKYNLVTNPVLFIINILIYSLYVFFIAFASGKLQEFKVFCRAIREGIRGDLEQTIATK